EASVFTLFMLRLEPAGHFQQLPPLGAGFASATAVHTGASLALALILSSSLCSTLIRSQSCPGAQPTAGPLGKAGLKSNPTPCWQAAPPSTAATERSQPVSHLQHPPPALMSCAPWILRSRISPGAHSAFFTTAAGFVTSPTTREHPRSSLTAKPVRLKPAGQLAQIPPAIGSQNCPWAQSVLNSPNEEPWTVGFLNSSCAEAAHALGSVTANTVRVGASFGHCQHSPSRAPSKNVPG